MIKHDTRQLIAEKLVAGMTAARAAREFDCSIGTIEHIAKANNTRSARHQLIARKLRSGMTARRVAREFGYTVRTIKRLAKLGELQFAHTAELNVRPTLPVERPERPQIPRKPRRLKKRPEPAKRESQADVGAYLPPPDVLVMERDAINASWSESERAKRRLWATTLRERGEDDEQVLLIDDSEGRWRCPEVAESLFEVA